MRVTLASFRPPLLPREGGLHVSWRRVPRHGSDQPLRRATRYSPSTRHQTTFPFPLREPFRRGTLSNGPSRRTLKSRRCLRVSTLDWYHARSETPDTGGILRLEARQSHMGADCCANLQLRCKTRRGTCVWM